MPSVTKEMFELLDFIALETIIIGHQNRHSKNKKVSKTVLVWVCIAQNSTTTDCQMQYWVTYMQYTKSRNIQT